MARNPVARFEDNQLFLAVLAEFVVDDQCVGRFLVFVEYVVAAHGADFRRVLDAQAPRADAHFVDTLVAEVAVSVVAEPVPVMVSLLLKQRP